MNVIDYEIYRDSGTVTVEEYVSETIGEITGVFEFEFETYTDYHWEYIGGRDVEVPDLAWESIKITSVNYYDEMGCRASWAMDCTEIENIIGKLLDDNMSEIEELEKEYWSPY